MADFSQLKDGTRVYDVKDTVARQMGEKANSAVQTIKINGVTQTKTDGTVNLPAYPTTLPASDVPSWAKEASKPTYTASEVSLGNVVNTGDSATPVANGTTKFTTGGAYTELNKKVDKVDGKGLSSNDYTTTEKTKLSGIETGAQVNVIESISVNGTTQTPTNKAVDIAVPEVLNDLDDAWVGTVTEYEAERDNISDDTVIIITDDDGNGNPLNYAILANKPQINGVTLTGNKTADNLGLATKTYVDQQITRAITQVLATSF